MTYTRQYNARLRKRFKDLIRFELLCEKRTMNTSYVDENGNPSNGRAMRELKFRVINEALGEVIGYERLSPTNGWQFFLLCESDEENPMWREGVIDTFGWDELKRKQYIGSRDKNGTEIYHNDILRDSKAGVCRIIWKDEKWKRKFNGWFFECEDISKNEIIGTTYENPELLEKETA